MIIKRKKVKIEHSLSQVQIQTVNIKVSFYLQFIYKNIHYKLMIKMKNKDNDSKSDNSRCSLSLQANELESADETEREIRRLSESERF